MHAARGGGVAQGGGGFGEGRHLARVLDEVGGKRPDSNAAWQLRITWWLRNCEAPATPGLT